MQIRKVDKVLVVGRLKGLLRQGGNLADTVVITAPRTYGALDLFLLNWMMRLYTPQGTLTEQPLTKTTREEEICLTWRVTRDFTAVAGDAWLELVGWREGGEELIKFPANGPIAVTADVVGAEPAPCVWEQALIDCQEAAGRAQAAAVHAPRVG